MHALLHLGAGYRTYLIAAGIIAEAVFPFLTGEITLGQVNFQQVLEGLGLATLRAGVSSVKK